MSTFDNTSDYGDQKNSEISSISSFQKPGSLKQCVPGRSYDCIIEKISKVVEEAYKTTLSPFTELLENNRIISERYNTEEKDDSWKVDPESTSEEDLLEQYHILKKKLQLIQNENKSLEAENVALEAKYNSIIQTNQEIKEKLDVA
ncbi:hypothetical protein TVAG_144050 [Trichomonas vaginalis G3]|uniref:Uncharacterized protein n=1 Tax=Trichomonas vaginalis (strain ATCC PRA-98 / G3) TaxID=412133 RepID=A2G0G0_TRIV3|nr:hypothetical protein TVAG_144050 [Trichomonas vaginalis G3]|eukprot:XP_001302287.1 hypothetical protein [Trichomonas vaginalis G3]